MQLLVLQRLAKLGRESRSSFSSSMFYSSEARSDIASKFWTAVAVPLRPLYTHGMLETFCTIANHE